MYILMIDNIKNYFTKKKEGHKTFKLYRPSSNN